MDLENYTEEQLFLFALKSEVDSNMVYSKVAEVVKNAFLKEKLLFLASEEDKHRQALEKIIKNRFPNSQMKLPMNTIVPIPNVSIPDENIPLSEVIDQAIKAELAAQKFYESVAERINDDHQLIRTLEYFAVMEQAHYTLLEQEKSNLERFDGYDEYWPMMHIGT